MSDRKIGNNKEACKIYKATGRLERNKKRNKARAERQAARAKVRITRRVMAGKAVPSKQAVKFSHKSKGTCIMLGTDITFAGCDAYASKHGLKGTSERVATMKLVDSNGKDVTKYQYRLVNVRRAA